MLNPLQLFVFSVYSSTPFSLDRNDVSEILSQVSPRVPLDIQWEFGLGCIFSTVGRLYKTNRIMMRFSKFQCDLLL